MADPRGAKRKVWSPMLVITAVVILAAVGMMVAVHLVQSRAHGAQPGLLPGGSHAQQVPQTQGQVRSVTPEYAAALRKTKIEQGKKAAAAGESYVAPPTPDVAHGEDNTFLLNANAPQPQSQQTGPATPSGLTISMQGNAQPVGGDGDPGDNGTGAQNARGRLAKRYAAALALLTTRVRLAPAATSVFVKKAHASAAGNGGVTASPVALESAPTAAPAAKTGDTSGAALPAVIARALRPGAMLFAENDLRLDSDSPGPVRVTILTAPLSGAIALGSMQKNGDYLRLKFSTITTRAGITYPVSGYGVDPSIPAADVRTAVDRHILSRWGGLIAGSFLQGYAQAISQAGATTNATFGTTTTVMPILTPTQELEVAMGPVGQQVANIAQKNFSRPDTVTLDPGVPLAILVIKQ